MTTYYDDSGAIAAARPELVPVASLFLRPSPPGPGKPGWLWPRVAAPLEVVGPGMLSFDGKTYRFLDDATSAGSGIRGLNEWNAPDLPPGKFETYNVTPKDYGLATPFDTRSPRTARLKARGGQGAVEIKYTRKSANHLNELIDRALFTAFASAISGEITPVTATGDQWSSAAADIAADLVEAQQLMEAATGEFANTMVLSAKAFLNVQKNTGLRTSLGLAIAPVLSPDQALVALGQFGIQYVHVGYTAKGLDDTVVLLNDTPGADVEESYRPLVVCWQAVEDYATDETGVGVRVTMSPDGAVGKVRVASMCDFVRELSGFVCIRDVH